MIYKFTNTGNLPFHEEMKQLAIHCYGDKGTIPAGYREVNIDKKYLKNLITGFEAKVYSDGANFFIAYKGTNFITDWNDDLDMVKSKIPAQYKDAIKLYDYIQKTFNPSDIFVTGHSLGGSLSQLVAVTRGCTAVTFNAYGVKDMLPVCGAYMSGNNIHNYINEYDKYTMVNAHNLVGNIYSVNKDVKPHHFVENMGDLALRKKRTIEEVKRTAEDLHRVFIIEKNILTFFKNPQNMSSGCVGSYPVSSYTRSDGIHVKGYTRHCGAKHDK